MQSHRVAAIMSPSGVFTFGFRTTDSYSGPTQFILATWFLDSGDLQLLADDMWMAVRHGARGRADGGAVRRHCSQLASMGSKWTEEEEGRITAYARAGGDDGRYPKID